MATHSSILAWETPWTEEPRGLHYSPRGHKESNTTERLNNNMKRLGWADQARVTSFLLK